MPRANSPEGLINNFQTQLEQEWSRFRNMEGDDSARGSSYESAFRDLLTEYFGGRFDIYTNCSVMDTNLSCFDEFGNGVNNEVDVVSLFSHATPRIVLREGDMTWVPLEGVSFLCEIKSQVDKRRLSSDLKKLSILRNLELDPNDRFGVTVSGDYSVEHQIHCLVYDKSSISDDSLNSLLEDTDVWDLVLLVEDDVLIVNQTLPVQQFLMPVAAASQIPDPYNDERFTSAITDEGKSKSAKFPGDTSYSSISIDSGLAWFMLALSVSISWPMGLSTAKHLSQLAMSSKTNLQFGASTLVNQEIKFEETDEVNDRQ